MSGFEFDFIVSQVNWSVILLSVILLALMCDKIIV